MYYTIENPPPKDLRGEGKKCLRTLTKEICIIPYADAHLDGDAGRPWRLEEGCMKAHNRAAENVQIVHTGSGVCIC